MKLWLGIKATATDFPTSIQRVLKRCKASKFRKTVITAAIVAMGYIISQEQNNALWNAKLSQVQKVCDDVKHDVLGRNVESKVV